jgi:hypothetical protein
MTDDLKFITEVLAIWEKDVIDLYWRSGKDRVRFYVNCNDVFAWACADAVEITPENVHLLKKSLEDTKGDACAGDLFCARVYEMRPQGACYSYYPKELWPLFDACGPEREVGFGNPYKAGEYQQAT